MSPLAGKEVSRKRGEMVERGFAHVLKRGCVPCIWLRGREHGHKRYVVYVAGYNLGVLMRALFGVGTPRVAAAACNAFVIFIQDAQTIVVVIVIACDAQIAALFVTVAPDPA